MAERTIPIPQPLFERQEQSFQKGGNELTQFLNDQRRLRFSTVDRITHLMPHISHRVKAGDFKQLENLDHIRDAEQLVNDRYQLYFDAVVANGTLNTHIDTLKPNSPPEQKYIQKKEATLTAIEDRKFIKPFTDEQKAAYFRIKEVSQQVREGTYQPPIKEKIIEQVREEIPETIDDSEKLKPKVVMNLSTYDEKETIIVNGREIPITLDGIITLETLSKDIESYVTKGELWKKLRTGTIKEEELTEIISQTSAILAQAGVNNLIADEPGKRTTNYYLDTDHFNIILDNNAVVTEEADQTTQDEEAKLETQAKRAPTLMFAQGLRINNVPREDFNMGDIRLLQQVANNETHLSSRTLSETTGIPQREVKAHITALARTLSRILQQPVSVESTTKGFRLAGVTFDIQTPPTTSEGEEERTDKPERQEIEVDFADRQISAILGALEYRILTQNKDNLVEAMGQTQYESLTESCRQLSLLVRASNPTTVEFAAAARRQGISLQEYQQIRSQLLNSIRGLRTAENRDELLATLSLDHQQVLNWLVNQPDIEFTQIVEEASSLGETPLKSEQDLYANSWRIDTTETQINNEVDILSVQQVRDLRPAITEAIRIAQEKITGESITFNDILRAYKVPGIKRPLIAGDAISYAQRNGIITGTSYDLVDLTILTLLNLTTPGKSLRSRYSEDRNILKAACVQIRQMIEKELLEQE